MTLLYEIIENNPHFCVVYKKPGASFHSEAGDPGLFELVKQRCKFTELFPVHRLDKMTSGLLVMAKTAAANQSLCEQFERRQVEKFYLAISQKKPAKKEGLVKGDMQPSRRGTWMLTKQLNNPAITQFFSKGVGDGRRLFVVRPSTGKTHQIRVALKSIGAPIAGDNLYGDSAQQAGVDRGYLHAYSLAFMYDEKHYRYTCLPREGQWFIDELFMSAMTEYLSPWELRWPRITGAVL